MQSTFGTSRIFNDMDGWYVIMRATDEKNLAGPKYKVIGDQHLMGPFPDKQQVEDWLDRYLAVHFENRDPKVSTINLQH